MSSAITVHWLGRDVTPHGSLGPLFDREAIQAAWIAWLRKLRWDWWATPTFRYPVDPTKAYEAVEQWLAPLPGAYAAFGVQRGPIGDRIHVHALVGGIGRNPLRLLLLRSRWRLGNIQLYGYCPSLGAIEYVVRQSDDIAIVGDPIRFRRRRHR